MSGGYRSNELPIVRRIPGEGTGEEIIETSDGTRWLVVSRFESERATAERRGLIIGGVIKDV